MICDKCKKESRMCASRDNSFDIWCYDCVKAETETITVKTARIDEIIDKIQPVNNNVLLSDIYNAIKMLENLKKGN